MFCYPAPRETYSSLAIVTLLTAFLLAGPAAQAQNCMVRRSDDKE
jgi:hypothetical protein